MIINNKRARIVSMPRSNSFDGKGSWMRFFNAGVACELHSLDEAVAIAQFQYWQSRKDVGTYVKYCVADNGAVIKDCKWVKDSLSSLKSAMPFWSKYQINRIMKKLRKSNLILRANLRQTNSAFRIKLNHFNYDTTSWYTLNNIKMNKLFNESQVAKDAKFAPSHKKTAHCKIASPNVQNPTNANCGTAMRALRNRNAGVAKSQRRDTIQSSIQSSKLSELNSNRKSDRKRENSIELSQLGQRIADSLVSSFRKYYKSNSRIHWLEKNIVEWVKQYPSTLVIHVTQDTIFNHMTNRPIHCPHCYIAKVLRSRYSDLLAKRRHYQRMRVDADKENKHQKKEVWKQQWEGMNPDVVADAQTNRAVTMLRKEGKIK